MTRALGNGVGLFVALPGLLAYLWFLNLTMDRMSYNTWGGLIVLPFVLAFDGVLLSLAWLREDDQRIRRVIVGGFLLKLVAVVGRYVMAYVAYNGGSDAERYNLYGAANYQQWRTGAFVWDWEGKQGTQMMELATTAVYTITGPTPLAAFFIFGSFAFWGIYLIHRAFKRAMLGADQLRYARLVFLLPSLLFWPSSIGKESWLMLFVGITAYGAARLFTRDTWIGLGWIAAGLVGTALVRPHVSVLLAAALFVAQVVRPSAKRSTGILTKLAGIVVMAVAALVLVTQSARFLGIDDLSTQAVGDELVWAGGQTAQGGSAFTPVPLDSPLGVPAAIVTLLFRPLPWEASNPMMVMQSAEGLLLIVLFIAGWRRLLGLPRLLSRSPYLAFGLVYALAFILAFAGFANFGILARQRVLMLPFVVMLLALPVQTKQWEDLGPKARAAQRRTRHAVRR